MDFFRGLAYAIVLGTAFYMGIFLIWITLVVLGA